MHGFAARGARLQAVQERENAEEVDAGLLRGACELAANGIDRVVAHGRDDLVRPRLEQLEQLRVQGGVREEGGDDHEVGGAGEEGRRGGDLAREEGQLLLLAKRERQALPRVALAREQARRPRRRLCTDAAR